MTLCLLPFCFKLEGRKATDVYSKKDLRVLGIHKIEICNPLVLLLPMIFLKRVCFLDYLKIKLVFFSFAVIWKINYKKQKSHRSALLQGIFGEKPLLRHFFWRGIFAHCCFSCTIRITLICTSWGPQRCWVWPKSTITISVSKILQSHELTQTLSHTQIHIGTQTIHLQCVGPSNECECVRIVFV